MDVFLTIKTFIHGRPTSVPGRWVKGYNTCDNAVCSSLEGSVELQDRDCESCTQERVDKYQVIKGFNDDRLWQFNFINVLTIFPNNDIKGFSYQLPEQRYKSRCD